MHQKRFLISFATILVGACVANAQLSRVRCIGALQYDGMDLPVTLNGTVVCSLPRGAVSAYTTVPSGYYRVLVNGEQATTVTLGTGVSYNLEFTGTKTAYLSLVNETTVTQQFFNTRLRVITLQPAGSGLTTVLVNGEPRFANLSETATTDYLSLQPGTYAITVGSTVHMNVELTASSSYSLVVWNGNAPAAIFIVDTTFIPCSLQIVHLAYGNTNSLSVSLDNGLVVSHVWVNVPYGTGDPSPLVFFQSNVDSGLSVKQVGQDQTLLRISNPNLVRYADQMIVLESVAATPSQLTYSVVENDITAPETAALARFEFLVGTDTLPPLDLRVDDVLLASGVTFGQLSAAVAAKPGAPNQRHMLRVFRAGEETNPLASVNSTAEGGSVYTVVLWGPPNALVLTQMPLDGADYSYAQMHFAHAVPGLGPIDVYVDNKLFWPNLAYKNTDSVQNTAVWPSATYPYSVEVFAAGTNTSLYKTNVVLPQPESFTLLFSGDALYGLSISVSSEFIGLIEDSALVRFAHLSPGTPALDVLLNGVPLVTAAVYKNVSDYNWDFWPGFYNITIRLSGTQAVFWEQQQYQMLDTSVHTIYAEGIYGNATYPFVGLTGVDFYMPGRARVSFLNALSDNVMLDSFFDGMIWASQIGGHSTSVYFHVAPRMTAGKFVGWTYNVTLAPTGALVPKVVNMAATFAEDAYFTLIAAGNSTAPQSLLLLDDNTFPTGNQTRIRFINLALGTNVTLRTPNATLFSHGGFLQPAGYISLPPGTYIIRAYGEDNHSLFGDVFVFAANGVYTLTFETSPPDFVLRSTLDTQGPPLPPPSPPPSPPEHGEGHGDGFPLAAAVAIGAGGFVLILVAIVVFVVVRRWRHRRGANYTKIDSPRHNIRPETQPPVASGASASSSSVGNC
eukprot:TRINITY_DN512_c0_g1_i2.p1 TRINITY_DN512_c0_g1~~TRINITY_DN512_c0_g1_i2.p1  ORF type:complete len:944 (-),score=229.11 TRINITY_DN512_c0_g1_i2:616-3321(-)